MKKSNILTVFIAMLALVLAACSGGANNNASGSGDTSNNSQGEVTEIEFWYGLGSEADNKMKEIIQEFNDSQDEVVVTPVPQADYDETFQKVQAAIASGTAPGVFIAELISVNNLGAKGVLAPLNEFTDEDPDFDQSDFLEKLMEPGIIGEEIYGIPGYGTTQVMYYRKDIYEEAGIDPEEAYSSWENLAKASKELQDQGLVDYGHLPMWKLGNLIDLALSNGGTIFNEDGTEVLIDSPEWVEAWEFIRKQVHEEKTMKINSGGQGWEYWYKTIDQVMNGSAAGYTGSSGDKGNLDFDIIESLPQPGLNGNPGKPIVNALYMAVPEAISDAEKEAAYKWISYFTSSEVNADWAQNIGYIPVRESVMDVTEYAEFTEKHPYAAVPYEQAQTASLDWVDPTGGKIVDALEIATDMVELQNVPAEEALKQAKEKAQKELDKVNNK